MKKTKRSLFFSTLAMVILLVVALSTATYAWYASQNVATGTGAKLVTAQTTDANIGLSVDATPSYKTQVELADSTGIRPMVPTTIESRGTVTNATLTFKEAVLGDNGSVFKEVKSASPWTQSNFKIKNLDPDVNRHTEITITVDDIAAEKADGTALDTTVADNLKGMLRVAIFVKEPYTVTAGSFKFLGVYGTGTAYYGDPVQGKAPTAYGPTGDNGLEQMPGGVLAANLDPFKIVGNAELDITAYAWLEGTTFDANYQDMSVTFNLTFTAGGNVANT